MTDWIKITAGPTVKAMADIDKRTDRATMYGLRAVGRKVKQEARRRAPVLKNQNLVNVRTVKALRKAGATGGESRSQPIPGLLKDSISSGKRLTKTATGYRIGIAPRGDRVHLYSGRMEARHHYMAGGHAAAESQMETIFVQAWTKATTPR